MWTNLSSQNDCSLKICAYTSFFCKKKPFTLVMSSVHKKRIRNHFVFLPSTSSTQPCVRSKRETSLNKWSVKEEEKSTRHTYTISVTQKTGPNYKLRSSKIGSEKLARLTIRDLGTETKSGNCRTFTCCFPQNSELAVVQKWRHACFTSLSPITKHLKPHLQVVGRHLRVIPLLKAIFISLLRSRRNSP